MESLKPLDSVTEPDDRQSSFVIFDNKTGEMRPLTLQDFHQTAAEIVLHAGVPENIRSHFETARNLLVYSWFYYPFNVTAQAVAYTTVEFALREKTQDRKRPLKTLLSEAVKSGWISDAGFSIAKRTQELVLQQNAILPPALQISWQPSPNEYSERLVEAIPWLRNTLAHGSSLLHEQGAMSVRICAELINQLFPEPDVTAAKGPPG